MSGFSVTIDRIRAKITYAPQPTLDPGSLGVIVVKQVGEFVNPSGTGPHYSSLIPNGPSITGVQLAAAPAWLVFFSGNMGVSGTVNNGATADEPRVFMLDNRVPGPDRTWAFAGARGSYATSDAPTLPISARNAQCSGAFYYIPN